MVLTGQIGGNGAAALLKNNFDSSTLGDPSNNIVHVWNDPSNPAFDYGTYRFVQIGNPNPFYDPLVVRNVNVTTPMGLLFNPSTGNDCPYDGYPNAGIRARGTVHGLTLTTGPTLTLTPNPAIGRVVVRYQLDADDAKQAARLVVRSVITGHTVREMSMLPGSTEAELTVQTLPEGVYACTLLVGGRPVQTQRLLVQR